MVGTWAQAQRMFPLACSWCLLNGRTQGGGANFNLIPLLCTLAGAFLIPYVVFFICCGIPVFFLETALGQFTSEGGITCWRKVCPLFEGKCWITQKRKWCLGDSRLWRVAEHCFNKVERGSNHFFAFLLSGIGYATQVIEAHLNVYYIIILAWAIFYLSNCFTTELPWATCGHEWNTGMAPRAGLSADPAGGYGIGDVSCLLLWVQVLWKLGVISAPGRYTLWVQSSEPELSTGIGISIGRRMVIVFPCFAKHRDWALWGQSRGMRKKH